MRNRKLNWCGLIGENLRLVPVFNSDTKVYTYQAIKKVATIVLHGAIASLLFSSDTQKADT